MHAGGAQKRTNSIPMRNKSLIIVRLTIIVQDIFLGHDYVLARK